MGNTLERLFHLVENGTNVRTEIMAGVTTFMTMSYIIFVQPAVLSQAGMDFDAVMIATCLSAAAATFIMGLLANYPIALAPGMGQNFFFTFTVVLAAGVAWETALGIVFISGIIFMILNLFRLRQALLDAIPSSLKHSIAAGIGFFIAFIGLADAGIIVRNNDPLVSAVFAGDLSPEGLTGRLKIWEYATGALRLGDLSHPAALLTLFGFGVILLLLVRRIKGAILLGILFTFLLALITGQVKWEGVASMPPSIAPTFFKLDLVGVFRWELIPIVLVFFFTDFFDTIGTLIGVGDRAGFIKNGKLPRASRALWADATGTVAGAFLGTSTVTSYIESAAGVEEGGRTGLTAVTTGMLFLLAIFFAPLVRMIGGGVEASEGTMLILYPITAPALIVVGCLMVQTVAKINWSDLSEAIPAFLVIIGMPLTYSISDGLAFGFVSYSILSIFAGRWRNTSWLVHALALVFAFRYIFL
ncbi:guanine permease [candidate division LCP-89 bacterium B3_LCP]|uniref:Guanine permease n=1 Tax=candidate division LCP-89 bacterium B3_LCP TaxID=2012998 RepID=A0A532V3N6_UNCL8|nr:MAG: guanine permease [candidate division LCP-89 bacterium B3_LCP]